MHRRACSWLHHLLSSGEGVALLAQASHQLDRVAGAGTQRLHELLHEGSRCYTIVKPLLFHSVCSFARLIPLLLSFGQYRLGYDAERTTAFVLFVTTTERYHLAIVIHVPAVPAFGFGQRGTQAGDLRTRIDHFFPLLVTVTAAQ
jgi:hypothetical protein